MISEQGRILNATSSGYRRQRRQPGLAGNLVGPGRGGQETLNLYAEALRRMRENPGLPPLFRSIFDNAFLPFGDPETLREFLKVIDEFPADDPETLGDPFEYLLSVMGAQGDAGQFRTPRHIIDFIVQAVDPQKDETILDPACGTGGFLIAARQHILNAHSGNGPGDNGNGNGPGDNGNGGPAPLTPDEMGRLAANLQGYDISPDMVRLARVNLYLHSCPAPQIHEYDTLTSEERWEERAEVILANPPFMSPKGGIRPHGRFAVPAKRSEVLFVDYIAEHLAAGGRAGAIVPEGVIFQSQHAYRQLRKMLVEQYLTAVVSLPAGVFQPYSGVKTSVLFLDRARAARSGRIALLKAANDGYDLGAQRRPSDRNDLPEVLAALREWREMDAADILPNPETAGSESWPPALQALAARGAALVVDKARIAADGDYNLSGERYREHRAADGQYEWAELGDLILGKPQYGSGARKAPYDGKVRYVRISDLTDSGLLKAEDPVSPSVIEPEYFLEPDDLLIARSGSVGRTYIHGDLPGDYQYGGYLIRFRINPEKALPKYVFHITQSSPWNEWILSNSKTGTLTNINAKQYSSFRLPLPPLEAQRELVAEVEKRQKAIDGHHQEIRKLEKAIQSAVGRAWGDD